MRKAKLRDPRGHKRRNRFSGTFDRLEERSLLAPVLTPVFGGTEIENPYLSGTYQLGGFVSIRLLSSQTGRIEADPTGAFGSDVFVVSRGTAVGTGGLIPTPVNGDNPATPADETDAAGLIFRVDPYGASAFGASPAENRRFFGEIPRGGVSFGGYEDWFDLAFDPTGNFNTVHGEDANRNGILDPGEDTNFNGHIDDVPTLFVSTLDSSTTAGINPKNAIYAFKPDGTFVLPDTPNPTNVWAYSTRDVGQPGILDTQLGAIAVAPGDTFGRDLYVLDVACDNPAGVTCEAGDGNAIFRVRPNDVDPIPPFNIVPREGLPIALDLPAPVPVIGIPCALCTLNAHVEAILPALPPPPVANEDIDVRAMIFDPNRGIILQGQFGEPAFQLYGGMFVASTDLESTDTGRTRVLHFPSPGFAPLDIIPAVPVQTRMIGDMAFDPVGHFGGGIFFTDYVTRSVFRIIQNPATGLGVALPVISNFNVLTPTQFLPTDPPGITPPQSYADAFSITFSADGEILFVSDRDGIWAFYANTLAHTAAGTSIGLTDIRELRAPYTGMGFGAAIIDTGVDAAHLGFRNTVAAGFNPAFPGPGNYDIFGHGTASAGIVHQIVPDAIIQPINTLNFATSNSYFTNQALYNSVRFVRDNPFVDDPRTPFINEAADNPATPQDDRIPIVAVNMSLGIRQGAPDANLISDRIAVQEDASIAIPLKSIFDDYLNNSAHGLGIVPVAAAGNLGQSFGGMKGADIPGILNETVEVAATYPYAASLDFFNPGDPVGPPITIGGTERCDLETGDNTAFVGKLTAFSNRNITTDFAAPGTCVSTYARSGFLQFVGAASTFSQAFLTGPITPESNGTSAAAPIVTGQFVFGYDVVSEWAKVVARGGVISPTDSDESIRLLNQYLTRDLGLTTTISIGGAVPDMASYLNADGINSILQWSAIPREDVNIGEAFSLPEGTDDDVEQERLLYSTRFRTYSHSSMAGFLAAVEGTIGLNYFLANPDALAALDDAAAGTPGLITAADIDVFVDYALGNVNDRAMARLLGGSDRIARLNRLTFLDLVQNDRQDGGILTAEIAALADKLLPAPDDFVITDRRASAEKPYALDPTALRNYHDFKFRSDMVTGRISREIRNMTPDEYHFGSRGSAGMAFLPVRGTDMNPLLTGRTPDYTVIGRAGDNVAPDPSDPPPPPDGEPGDTDPPVGDPPGNGVGPVDPRASNNFTVLNEAGTELIYHTDSSGNLVEHARNADGSWSVTNITEITRGPQVQSDLLAIDLAGGSSRAIFGLTADDHIARFDYAGGSWTAVDVTSGSNLPAISSSLTGLVIRRGTTETTLLYGLSPSGELIEYRPGTLGWTARNITRETRGLALEPGLTSWGAAYRKKSERLFVFGTTVDGRVIQHTFNGKRWARVDLSNLPGSPQIAPDSLVAVQPPVSTRGGGTVSLFALDTQGSLWRYGGSVRAGWVSLTDSAGGPALVGEVTTQYEAATNTTYVFGRDNQGRMVQYAGQYGGWSWSLLSSGSVVTGDLAASGSYRVAYSELVDGAIAEFSLGDTWNFRRLDAGSSTAGAADGSTDTSRLITLGIRSR